MDNIKLPALPLLLGAFTGALAANASSIWYFATATTIAAVAFFPCIRRTPHAVTYFFCGLVATILSSFIQSPPTLGAGVFDGEKRTFTMLVDDMHAGRKGVTAQCLVIDTPKPFKCRVQFTDESINIESGDIVKLKAILEPVDRHSEISYLSSEIYYNKSAGIVANIVARPEDAIVTGHSQALKYRFRQLRERFATAIYASRLSPQSAALLAASCLGTGDAPADVKEQFRLSGLSHLLCVSGFHVAVVAWIISLLLLPMRLWSHGGRWRYALLIVFVWLYVCLTGLIPSAQRAALMISAFYIARLLQRKANSFNTLSLAVGIMLIADPLSLYAVGFQLSVSAVAGILIFANILNPVAQRNRLLYRAMGIFTTPLAAMLGSAPVVLMWFHRLPIMSIPCNALASLIFPAFMVIGSAAAMIGNSVLIKLTDELRTTIMALCDIGGNNDFAFTNIYLDVISLSMIIMTIILIAVSLHSKRWKWWALSASVVPVISLTTMPASAREEPEILIHGNGYGSEICYVANGKASIIPCGGRGKALGGTDAFFAGHKANEAHFIPHTGFVKLNNTSIAIAGRHTHDLKPADYLIIDASYTGDVSEAVGIVKPGLIIIGANVAKEKVAEISNLGHPIHQLFYKSLSIKQK